ncbi:MAG: hypothetical protein ACK4SA_24635 [Caldilinea sp.]
MPWADHSEHRKTFSPDELPFCAVGLPMLLKSTFWQQSHCLVPHQIGRYGCRLVAQGSVRRPLIHLVSLPHCRAPGLELLAVRLIGRSSTPFQRPAEFVPLFLMSYVLSKPYP